MSHRASFGVLVLVVLSSVGSNPVVVQAFVYDSLQSSGGMSSLSLVVRDVRI